MTSPNGAGAHASIPLPAAVPTVATLPAPPPAPGATLDAWLPDIDALIASGLAYPQTEILKRVDDLHLFYAGRLHSVIGEPGSLKTWLTLLAAYQEIRKGNRVMFLDYEDVPQSVLARMRGFGLDDVELRGRWLDYVRPDSKFTQGIWDAIDERIHSSPASYTLVIIDGVTEIMSMHGWKVNEQEDVARLYNEIAKWFTQRGLAVVMIDHVTKSRDGRGKDAIGAQHKRAGIDGASYAMELHAPLGKSRHGRSVVTLAKDKNGAVQSQVESTVGIFNITLDPTKTVGGIKAWIDLPMASTATGVAGASRALVEKVLAQVRTDPGKAKGVVAEAVGGTRAHVMKVIDELVDQGYLENKGTRNAGKLHFVREYEGDTAGLEDLT